MIYFQLLLLILTLYIFTRVWNLADRYFLFKSLRRKVLRRSRILVRRGKLSSFFFFPFFYNPQTKVIVLNCSLNHFQIKILAVLIFIIVGCFTSGGVIGGTVYGFKYWADPGAFSHGVLGVLNAFVLASFSMQGTEIVGITAGESEHPTKDIPRAIRNVFWRLLIFYLGSGK